MAQLVEYDLAKVGVAGSNPVCRSKKLPVIWKFFYFMYGIGFTKKGCREITVIYNLLPQFIRTDNDCGYTTFPDALILHSISQISLQA